MLGHAFAAGLENGAGQPARLVDGLMPLAVAIDVVDHPLDGVLAGLFDLARVCFPLRDIASPAPRSVRWTAPASAW